MPADITVDKEMAVTRAMFLDTLARALAGRAHRIEGSRVIVEEAPRRMELALLSEGERRLGSFVLPASHVRVSLSGYSESEAEDALAWFDRWFQRAGG